MYLMEGMEYMELTADNGTIESLWVIIKGQNNNVDVFVGVCYGPLSQDHSTDKLHFEELRYTSMSTALVLWRTSARQ